MGGGGSGGSGPTVQQKQLETQQGITNANLNLEENSQRKAILNSMTGTRVFRGSALSRAVSGNAPGTAGATGAGPASASQINTYNQIVTTPTASLLDQQSRGSGATPAGGAGASVSPVIGGGRAGGGGSNRSPIR